MVIWNDATIAQVADDAAQRLSQRDARCAHFPETAVAEDIRALVTNLLRAIESGGEQPDFEAYLNALQQTSLRQAFRPTSVLLLLLEVEASLANVIELEDGAAALGSTQWRSIQVVLRFTIANFVAKLPQ